jgi:hypothetical protein
LNFVYSFYICRIGPAVGVISFHGALVQKNRGMSRLSLEDEALARKIQEEEDLSMARTISAAEEKEKEDLRFARKLAATDRRPRAENEASMKLASIIFGQSSVVDENEDIVLARLLQQHGSPFEVHHEEDEEEVDEEGEEDEEAEQTNHPWASRYRRAFEASRGRRRRAVVPGRRRDFGMFEFGGFVPQQQEREMTYEEMLALDESVVKKTLVKKNMLSSFELKEKEQAHEPCSICLESFAKV